MFLTRLFRSRRVRIGALVGSVAASVGLLTLPYWLPQILGWDRRDLIFRVPSADRRVFVTIDDSPSASTGAILDVLAKHKVTATFFITGSRVHDSAQVAAIRANGHALGHHMKTTQACSSFTLQEFQRDFDEVDRLLKSVSGAPLFRPPSDFGTTGQIAHAASKGYIAVAGTVFPLDHWLEDPAWLCRIANWLTVDGGIIILHDGPVRGSRTAIVLDALIPDLKRKGFEFGNLAAALGVAAVVSSP
jgi:peptidoglycan-N-acetylglucosamine deacetylase